MRSLITKDSATVLFDDGTQKLVTAGNNNFAEIVRRLRAKQFDGILDLIDEGGVVRRFIAGLGAQGILALDSDGDLTYSGQKINHVMIDQLRLVRQQNGDVQPLLNFLERLLNNPSSNSVRQFYDFIGRNGLIIEPTGHVLAYKGVRHDYKDVHTGKFDNSPGAINAMPRTQVDDNPNAACSTGFHVGGWDYVKDFGDRKMIVRFDPADVGSVPHDAANGKVRLAKYEVVGEVDGEWFKLNKPYTELVVTEKTPAPLAARIQIGELHTYALTIRTLELPSGKVLDNTIDFTVVRTNEPDVLDKHGKEAIQTLLEEYVSRSGVDLFPESTDPAEQWNDYAILEYLTVEEAGINQHEFQNFKVDIVSVDDAIHYEDDVRVEEEIETGRVRLLVLARTQEDAQRRAKNAHDIGLIHTNVVSDHINYVEGK